MIGWTRNIVKTAYAGLGLLGLVVTLWMPLYRAIDMLGNLDFLHNNWGEIGKFLDSGMGTLVSVAVGAIIIGYSIIRGLQESGTNVAVPSPTASSNRGQKLITAGLVLMICGAVALVLGGILFGIGKVYFVEQPLTIGGMKVPPSDDSRLMWDDHLGHTYSTEGTTVITQAIQIGAKNGSERELRLEDAYIVSGQGSGEVPLKVGSDHGWIAPKEASAIPLNGPIVFRAEFTPTPAREFFEKWKTFRITVKHDGGAVLTKDINEEMVAAIYSSFRPNPIGPQVTAKPTTEDKLVGRARFLYDQRSDIMRVISKQDLEIVTIDKDSNYLLTHSGTLAMFNFGHFTARFVFPKENGPFVVKVSGERIGPMAMMAGSVIENEKSYVKVQFYPTINTASTSLIVGEPPTSAEVTISFYKR